MLWATMTLYRARHNKGSVWRKCLSFHTNTHTQFCSAQIGYLCELGNSFGLSDCKSVIQTRQKFLFVWCLHACRLSGMELYLTFKTVTPPRQATIKSPRSAHTLHGWLSEITFQECKSIRVDNKRIEGASLKSNSLCFCPHHTELQAAFQVKKNKKGKIKIHVSAADSGYQRGRGQKNKNGSSCMRAESHDAFRVKQFQSLVKIKTVLLHDSDLKILYNYY